MNRFNEEMMESLFGYTTPTKDGSKKSLSQESTRQIIQIIDTKKSQNLSILLKALNVTTEEVCDALEEGNFYYDALSTSSNIGIEKVGFMIH